MFYLACYTWYGKVRAQNEITVRLLSMRAVPVGASAWLIKYSGSAEQLKNDLEPYLGEVSQLIVTQFLPEESAWTENRQDIQAYLQHL